MSDMQTQIDWLDRLIRHDTTSAVSNLQLIEDVESWLQHHNIESVRVASADGKKANLYAVVGPKVAGGVVLSGHTDVVPVVGQDWTSDPFVLCQRDNRLYGRGTCDMKAFSAIGLSLIPEMLAADLQRPIIFALSYDEEVGCLGAPDMIAEIVANVPRPSAVIVGEPSMMKVIDGHKGISAFRTHIAGHTTHSSQTHRGVSAVMVAAEIIQYINHLAAELEENAIKTSPFTPPSTSLTVNVIRGGTQLNIMAGECAFEWDLRSVPGDDPEQIYQKVLEYSAHVEHRIQQIHPDCKIKTEWMTKVPVLEPRTNNAARDLALRLTGHNHTEAVPYATEGGQFQAADIPTVICGPGSIDQAHQADEFISLEQMKLGTQFIRKLIADLSRS